MPDAKDFAPNNPVYQKESPQPPLRELSLRGEFSDNMGVSIDFFLSGYYHDEERDGIRVIEHKLLFSFNGFEIVPTIDSGSLYWILDYEIKQVIKITGTIHFDQKLEI